MLSWRAARHLAGPFVSAIVVFGVLMPTTAQAAGTDVDGGAPAEVASAPAVDVAVAKQKIPTRSAPVAAQPHVEAESGESGHTAADHVVAALTDTKLKPFSMFGVTWKGGLPEQETLVEARWRSDGGWSDWTELHVDPAPEEGGLAGTEPQWVESADAAEVRVLSTADAKPRDLSLAMVDASTSDDSASPASMTSLTTTEVAPAASVSQPPIILRSAWGASSAGSCDSPRYGSTTRGAVIHHTAGSNTYEKSQSAGIVKATQAYHMNGRNWCDIGYNFLVDKYGQIFEGRAGGIDKPVRAAHSGNDKVNQETMGVSLMGTFTSTNPSSAMKSAVVDLVSWRFAQYGIPATGTYSLGGKTLNRIAGHRNVVSTECPGARVYSWLSADGGLRDSVTEALAGEPAPVTAQIDGRKVSNVTSSGFDLRWSPYAGAATYEVAVSGSSTRPTSCGTGCKTYAASSSPKRSVRGVTGKTYYAWVRAFSSSGRALTVWQTAPKTIHLVPAEPVVTAQIDGRKVSNVTSSGFDLRWSPFAGAATYEVAVSGSSTRPTSCGTGCKTYAASSSPKRSVRGVTGKTYYAWVRAFDSSGRALTVWQTAPKTIRLAEAGGTGPVSTPPTVTAQIDGRKVSNVTSSGFDLRWTPFAGAATYEVAVSGSSTRPTSCGTGCKTYAASSSPKRSVRGVTGKTYYAWVRAFDSSGRALTVWQTAPKTIRLAEAVANSVTVPSTRKISVKGHGYGHGIGMSQYGAQGAAKRGVRHDKILSTYYPGTALGSRSGDIRVLISQDTTDPVEVKGASGLVFRDVAARTTLKLPTTISGKTVTHWRITQVTADKKKSTLQYKTTGSYTSYHSTHWTGDGQFEGPSTISLIMPDGSAVKYRGAVRSAVPSAGSTSRNTVNVLPIESYVRGVIAAEMPASWEAEALKAQAVAARTYGVRSITSSRYYDICSTTACQVYGGASRETASTDAAVKATAGQIVTYGGKPAFTQFSSSSGGYTAVGSQPYLKAISDPYDNWSGNHHHSWTTSVAASKIEKAYPAIGALKQLKITKRNGYGDLGGRVSAISLIGAKKTVSISGDDARWAFGLSSNWFAF